MNLQTIKSLDGKVEYVLLPVAAYKALRHQITEQLKWQKSLWMRCLKIILRLVSL